MEVGGFAVGTVALVSLFKDCVELYSMFTSAKNLEKDSASLKTKLDIEENAFFTWSEKLGLLDQGQSEPVFSNPHTRNLVMQILENIKDLLNDGSKLQKTYGVESAGPHKQTDSSILPERRLEPPSDFQLSQFIKDFRSMKIRDTFQGYRSRRLAKIGKQIAWVIVDKEKFNQLIADLSYYNSRLAELAPASASLSSALELGSDCNVTTWDVVVKVPQESSIHREAAMAARLDAIRTRVLNTLWFRWLDDRMLTVKDAHAKTFSWALDPESKNEQWSHLPTWLQSGSEIYWLRGKAGSGKSTLMKFLHNDERTQQYLKLWAGGSELICSNFFFYALGHEKQKSQVGLLRSLLYQVLSLDPALTETVLPHAWREACSGHERKPEDLSIPSVAEMTKALKDICKLYQPTKKMFFLIDGIDEYEGEDMDVAEFISGLGGCSNVKILVSSRPHSSFFTAFRESPSMELHRLTERDIASYVNDTVISHPYMKGLSILDPSAAESITTSLIERASGVFLWVVLVCRSIIEGCDEHETALDLQARVDESPKEVMDLLKHIISTIQPRWEDEAMKIMHLVYTNNKCDGPLPIFGLHLICEQGYNSDIHSSDIRAWGPYTTEQRELKCSAMEGRLRSRCRGLVELECPSSDQGRNECDWFDNEDKTPLSVRHCNVNFMHRTVFELLSRKPIFNRHFGKIERQGFDSYFVLCNLWCHLTASSNETPTCKIQTHETKGCTRVNCLTNAIGIIRYGHYNGCNPEILLHCISRIQYTCAVFLHDEFFHHTKYFLHDRKCRNYFSDMSVVLALAAECALYRTIQLAYESNVPLQHLLYQPLSLESLKSCHNGHEQEAGSLGCHKDQSYHAIETKQRTLNLRSSLSFHCVLSPYLTQTCTVTYFYVNDPNRLRSIEFIVANERLDSREIKTLLDGFDLFCDREGERCNPIWKDIQTFLHSRLE